MEAERKKAEAEAAANAADDAFQRSFGIDLRRNLVTRDASANLDETADEDAAAYLKNRRDYSSGLEDVFQTSPFESYPIMRGQTVGRLFGSNTRQVGLFKGVVRLCNTPSDPSPVDMTALLNPKVHVVRLYVLTGHRIQPKDT